MLDGLFRDEMQVVGGGVVILVRKPSSAARAFIRSTKAQIEPLKYSSMTLQASLAEATSAQIIRFSRLIDSPAVMPTVLLSHVRSKRQLSEAVTMSR